MWTIHQMVNCKNAQGHFSLHNTDSYGHIQYVFIKWMNTFMPKWMRIIIHFVKQILTCEDSIHLYFLPKLLTQNLPWIWFSMCSHVPSSVNIIEIFQIFLYNLNEFISTHCYVISICWIFLFYSKWLFQFVIFDISGK